MDYMIREMRKEEYDLLEDFLYEAIFIPEGISVPSKSIIMQPGLQVYITDRWRYKRQIMLLKCIERQALKL